MIKRWLALALCLWGSPAPAQIIIDAVPGGVAEIPLGPASGEPPQAFFGQRRILVTESGPNWVGIVGIPLSLVPGRYVVQTGVDDNEEPVAYEFTVFPRHLREQPIVKQPELTLESRAAGLEWRETLDADLPLDPPLSEPARPLFGRHYQRSSGESRYLEFVAFNVAADTPIKAPDDGRVDRVEAHQTGTLVWIDHGMGLFTRTGPLTRATVSQGEAVKTGQTIGRVALDATDPPRPLYWSVFLNGTAVNPFLLSDLDKAPLQDPDTGSAAD